MSNFAYLARQPILDKDEKLYAYELLFRDGMENFFPNIDADKASSSVISSTFMLSDIENIVGNARAFINATDKILKSDFFTLLPKDKIVVEVLESVTPSYEILDACFRLKEKGYLIALDDFEYDEKWEKFFSVIDIIKVDFIATKGSEREDILYKIGQDHITYLAEKVETYEEFEYAKEIGYSLFQGYFFSKPHILKMNKVPENKLAYFNLFKEINKQDFDMDAIAEAISFDVSLTYKLLKFINSAFFGLRNNVTSIKQAIALLGIIELRKWASLVILSVIGADHPQELLFTTFTRAKFCELIALKLYGRVKADEAFLIGMFSTIDALLGVDKKVVLESIGVSDEIKNAILNMENELGTILKLTLAYEHADWDVVCSIATKMKMDGEMLTKFYLEAVEWMNRIQI